jgi:exodeoxyribonuclease VII large subunit
MSRKPAEQPPEREQLSLTLPAGKPNTNTNTPPTPPAPAQPRVYVVSDLLKAARLTLESRFTDVRVEGEVSGLRRSGNGHIYFALKDAEASLDCVLFSREAKALKFSLEDGMAVRCRGRLTIYEARGKFQMTVDKVEPTGAGALALAFEQLKQRLGAEGLFDPARKRPLPFLPRRIGVVTSASGAVIRDIVRVAHRRFPVPILLAATPVQGEGAALGIAAGIRKLEAIADVDVIIVARGGGSLEDLWAFNEEPVARAIHACRVPVISAVGHETDFTIADFVADLRAPTPSAAAEMVVAAKDEFCGRIDRLTSRLRAAARSDLQRRLNVVHVLSRRRGLAGFHTRLAMRGRHAAELTHELRGAVRGLIESRAREYRGLRQRLEQRDLARRLASIRGRLSVANGRLDAAIQLAQHRADGRFRALAGRLESLSPLAVLGRGYAVCWNADKTAIVRSAASVDSGDVVRVTLADGEIGCRVETK